MFLEWHAHAIACAVRSIGRSEAAAPG